MPTILYIIIYINYYSDNNPNPNPITIKLEQIIIIYKIIVIKFKSCVSYVSHCMKLWKMQKCIIQLYIGKIHADSMLRI